MFANGNTNSELLAKGMRPYRLKASTTRSSRAATHRRQRSSTVLFMQQVLEGADNVLLAEELVGPVGVLRFAGDGVGCEHDDGARGARAAQNAKPNLRSPGQNSESVEAEEDTS
jgi:hypothetical protein